MLTCLGVCIACAVAGAQDELAKATNAAIEFASKSVVQIDTIGGLTPEGQSRSTAPFSGTVVSADGVILTASYNLLHEPASFFVKLPGDGDEVERLSAKVIATDSSRNVTFLKIDRADLTPIQFADHSNLRVGERAIAIGKSMSVGDANVSFGIVSAKGRIWNRATQTDAKISRQNYGGPLVTLTGEAIGILVPMSHSSSEVVAGAQWYDSGIGFAANIDPNSVAFKRLLGGESLRPGLMGVTFEGQDENADPAKVSFCLPTSPAGKAGLKVGDTIVAAAEQKIIRQGQLKHIVGPLYEKETLKVRVDRDGKLLDFEIELAGEIDPYVEPEIGVLLANGDAAKIEFVILGSPAEIAELSPGDVITKLNDKEIENAAALREAVSQLVAGESCQLELSRDGKTTEVDLETRRQTAEPIADFEPRNQPASKTETICITVAEGSNACDAFVPRYDDNVESPPSVLVWVPAPGPVDSDRMKARFEEFCLKWNTIVLVPQSVDPDEWLPDDASVIAKAVERLEQQVKFDPNRVAIAGEGPGGLMAIRTAFGNRKTFHGVIVVDAELTTRLPNLGSQPSLRMHLMIVGGEDVEEGVEFFRKKGFSVFAIDQGAGLRLPTIFRWVAALDRL